MSITRGVHAQHLIAMRRHNTATCIEVLRSGHTFSVGSIAQRTGLSRPTIESILEELAATGLVAEETPPVGSDSDPKAAGRPARRFSFQASARTVASIDVGVHRISGSLCDLRGEVLATLAREAYQGIDPAARAASVHELIHQLTTAAGLPSSQLHTVVVSVPGIVDAAGRILLSNPLPDWNGVDLKARFADGLPARVRVIVENDVNMAALAEHKLGAGSLADDMLYLHIGYRMNAALVLDGNLRRGYHYAAGEIGDMYRSPWESPAWSAWGPLTAPDADLDDWADAAQLLADAKAGNRAALDAVDGFAQRVGFTLAVTSAAIDPQLVIIGGGLSAAGEILVRPIRAAVDSYFSGRVVPDVVASRLGGDATTLGGLVRGLQEINDELYHAPQLPTPAPFTPHHPVGSRP